jgi:hypothetical protein
MLELGVKVGDGKVAKVSIAILTCGFPSVGISGDEAVPD